MFDPNEAFEFESDDSNEDYDPLQDDLEYDEDILDQIMRTKGMQIALDGFKMFLQSLSMFNVLENNNFDWYEKFMQDKANGKRTGLVIDTRNPHLVEYATMFNELPEDDDQIQRIKQEVEEDGLTVEFNKILDAFGYYEAKFEDINTAEDLLKELGNE